MPYTTTLSYRGGKEFYFVLFFPSNLKYVSKGRSDIAGFWGFRVFPTTCGYIAQWSHISIKCNTVTVIGYKNHQTPGRTSRRRRNVINGPTKCERSTRPRGQTICLGGPARLRRAAYYSNRTTDRHHGPGGGGLSSSLLRPVRNGNRAAAKRPSGGDRRPGARWFVIRFSGRAFPRRYRDRGRGILLYTRQ